LAYSSTSKMEAVPYSKMPSNFTSVDGVISQTTAFFIVSCYENLESYILCKFRRFGLTLEKQNTKGRIWRELRPHQHAFICMQHVHIMQTEPVTIFSWVPIWFWKYETTVRRFMLSASAWVVIGTFMSIVLFSATNIHIFNTVNMAVRRNCLS
jgi:hypothetical protein